MDIIVQAATMEKMKVHAIRFDHEFLYWSAYNTTDRTGITTFMKTISQFASRYVVQYYFNIEKKLIALKTDKEQVEFLKSCLMTK